MTNLSVVNTLFVALMCFVAINAILSFFLWRYSQQPVYSKILKLWLASFIYLGTQFFVPVTQSEIVLVYGVGIIPMLLTHSIVCEILGEETSYDKFILFFVASVVLTAVFIYYQMPFVVAAMPFALALAYPLVIAIKMIFVDHKKTITLLQKVLGLVLIAWVIQIFNFAFFRMAPNAPLYGWVAVYGLYDILAIVLPAVSIEEHLRTEKARLQRLVTERTQELSVALTDKETLLKILIHDISNPLTVMRWYLKGIKTDNGQNNSELYLSKIERSQEIVENVVKKVKELQTQPNTKLSVISITKCVEEMKFVFEKALQFKNITLQCNDESEGHDQILADQFTFTHSILSNLVSNAIKFSFSDSIIFLTVKKDGDRVKVIITDSGVGMKKETIQQIQANNNIESTPGTQGEHGTGYGLGIVSSMIRSFNGQMEIFSSDQQNGQKETGTTIVINLPSAKIEGLT